ncbi:hypothetical protein E0485_21720 [Paenibacillus albiflavus]|uniref:Uncharacterized protein n=1 Tax=Paenibacillus albiflavus TaxID=2545760 RepID=A0A4R4E4V6_9BACL|nr:DUF2161 family putative PD-(D/E)XK-type phosphodiesterase [Paenibacillus albiflavus]TCZ73041.1 hypothetical protein E0485_21720 [Paenibacillus albiflavus]
MAIQSETELYEPVKKYWISRGYEVRGEVKHCDLVAVQGNELVVVELKRSFTIPLLVQGIDRQRLTDRVYVAIELPNKGRAPHRLSWGEVRRLCELLGLGLMTVRFYKTRREPLVEVVCHPPRREDVAGDAARTPAKRVRVSKKAAERLAAEFESRHGDFNVGGSPGGKRQVTAYRERALLCAAALAQHGPLSLRELRERTGCAGAAAIMQRNAYGWFARHQRGVYALLPEGEAALTTTFADVVSVIACDLR